MFENIDKKLKTISNKGILTFFVTAGVNLVTVVLIVLVLDLPVLLGSMLGIVTLNVMLMCCLSCILYRINHLAFRNVNSLVRLMNKTLKTSSDL